MLLWQVAKLRALLTPISFTGRLFGVMYGESVSSNKRKTEDVRSLDEPAKFRITCAVFRFVA